MCVGKNVAGSLSDWLLVRAPAGDLTHLGVQERGAFWKEIYKTVSPEKFGRCSHSDENQTFQSCVSGLLSRQTLSTDMSMRATCLHILEN